MCDMFVYDKAGGWGEAAVTVYQPAHEERCDHTGRVLGSEFLAEITADTGPLV